MNPLTSVLMVVSLLLVGANSVQAKYGGGQGTEAEPYLIYEPNNVNTCWQSFRLVNATDMCASQDKGWASLGLDLGPQTNGVIESRDVSSYQYFVFWSRTDNVHNPRIKVLFRDADANEYSASPNPPGPQKTWSKQVVSLNSINGINLRKLVHVALEFGGTVGNEPNTIIYIDDMGFTGSETMTPLSNGSQMPAIFPQHWPYGSVAATGWFIFVELNTNPFAVFCETPLMPFLVPVGDLNADCWINFGDLGILAQQWLQDTGSLSADIAPEGGDGIVDLLDMAVIAKRWLRYGD
jgi:hypothetical protein